MTPDRVDLDYLRAKAAEYRRGAKALASGRMSTQLLEIARRYEARLRELEASRTEPPSRTEPRRRR
jgi:hypothetical protein